MKNKNKNKNGSRTSLAHIENKALDALDIYEKILISHAKDEINNPQMLTHIAAQLFFHVGNSCHAKHLLNQVIEKHNFGDAYYLYGAICLYLNDYDDAYKYLKKAVDEFSISEANYELGLLSYGQGNIEQALSFFYKTLELNAPNAGDACLEIANIRYSQHNMEETIHYLHLSADKYNNPNAQYFLGLHYFPEDQSKATTYILKVVENKNSSDDLLIDINLLIACFAIYKNDYKTAEIFLEKIKDTEDPSIQTLLGNIYIENKKFGAARKILNMAISAEIPSAYSSLGFIALNKNQITKAKQYLHIAADKYKDYEAAYVLADIYAQEENIQKKEYYKNCCKECKINKLHFTFNNIQGSFTFNISVDFFGIEKTEK